MENYQEFVKKINVGNHGLPFYALGLNEEAGEVAGKIKRLIRDHGGIMTPEIKTGIISEMGDTLWYLTAMANKLGISLAEIMNTNMAKLKDRAKRNKLHGSGDTR